MDNDKGIIISLITFEGEESKIEIHSMLGDIIKVKPSEILFQFSNIQTTEISLQMSSFHLSLIS